MAMNHEIALLNNYLIVGALLFGIGLIGFVSRRNMIVMFLSAEIMLQGVSLSLVAWGRFHNDFGGQMLVVFIIAVAACEAAVALALIVTLFQRRGRLDVVEWQMLREANQPPFREQPAAEEFPERPQTWPHLPPAGVRPEIPAEETEYRPVV
jgi:NADH-quinone oxidoreductase subunit K